MQSSALKTQYIFRLEDTSCSIELYTCFVTALTISSITVIETGRFSHDLMMPFLGGGEKVKIQSMCTTKTSDAEATVKQINGLEKAGWLEPTRTDILCDFIQSATALTALSLPILPGFIRTLCGSNSKAD